jgi:UDP-glucose 4-epimerase
MRILVTGGAGFIGSHVVDAYLAAGHEVGVVDDLSSGSRENLDLRAHLWPLDIRHPDLGRVVGDFRPEIISHHAAQMSVAVSARDPRLDAEINVLGSVNLLDAAVRHKVRRIVFASTGGAMYGEQEQLPTPETVFPEPVSPYGVAKLAMERYLHAFRFMHGLEAAALRYANVYGPRQNPHGEAGVVAIFSRAIIEGRPFTVNGDGEQTRDYTYVGDIVRANLLATMLPAGPRMPILNIGTSRETSVNDLVRVLGEIAGRPLDARYGPGKPGEQRRSALDAGLAKRVLGWEPATDLKTGLAATFAWFQQQHGTPRP